MRKPKFLTTRNFVGFGGLALTVAPYFEESDKMNALTWVLVAVGSGLVLWGIAKPEHQLSPKENEDLLKNRRQYLPKLKNNIEKQTLRLEYIRGLAGKITFTQYLEKYYPSLKGTKKKTDKRNINDIYLGSKIGSKATMHNLYYHDLKRNDGIINGLGTEYDLLIARLKDSNLKHKLKDYWDFEDANNSRIVLEQIMINDKFEIKPESRKRVNLIEKLVRGTVKQITIRQVIDRIDELIDGVPDE